MLSQFEDSEKQNEPKIHPGISINKSDRQRDERQLADTRTHTLRQGIVGKNWRYFPEASGASRLFDSPEKNNNNTFCF